MSRKTLEEFLLVFDSLLGFTLLVLKEDSSTADGIVQRNLGLVEFPVSGNLLIRRICRIRNLLFENDIALKLLFDTLIELGFGDAALLEFLVKDFDARVLSLEKLCNAVDTILRDLDGKSLGFELDQFLTDKIIDDSPTNLLHGFRRKLTTAGLSLGKSFGKAVHVALGNSGLTDLDYIKIFTAHELSGTKRRTNHDGDDRFLNKIQKAHKHPRLKFLTPII